MYLVEAQAYCRECDWRVESRNAMGVAAKHFYKTGHEVFVELGYAHIYGMKPEKETTRDKSGKSKGE